MKWLRWFRLSSSGAGADPAASEHAPRTGRGTSGLEVGQCEVCGSTLHARTRKAQYHGRVTCECGHRNHVEFLPVRGATGLSHRHVSLTVGRKFEAATHEPDLRLPWRFGRCPSCSTAVSLLDAFVIAHENALRSVETYAYYCHRCHVHDDPGRGRLAGHDGAHIVDTLRFLVRT